MNRREFKAKLSARIRRLRVAFEQNGGDIDDMLQLFREYQRENMILRMNASDLKIHKAIKLLEKLNSSDLKLTNECDDLNRGVKK